MFKHIAYPAIFTKDGNYICVDFPDLEGCLTQGETIEEAYFAAKEALALYLDTVGECPPPSAVEAVKPLTASLSCSWNRMRKARSWTPKKWMYKKY